MIITFPQVKRSLLPDLWQGRCVSVAGQNLEYDAPTAVPQKLLELVGVGTNLTTIHLTNDVARVQHALSVNRTAMQDPCNHHLPLLHTKCHPLKHS